MVFPLDELGDAGAIIMPDGADSATGFEEYHKIAEAEHPASFLWSGIPARGYREPSVMIQSIARDIAYLNQRAHSLLIVGGQNAILGYRLCGVAFARANSFLVAEYTMQW
ncbi:MAG TPA: hypothetical protein VGC14_25090 [Rhizobium sp.]